MHCSEEYTTESNPYKCNGAIYGTKYGTKDRSESCDIQQLNEQIAEEEQRSEEIEEYRKYTQTKKYAEDVAKEKLGLVYEGEIIFKEEE